MTDKEIWIEDLLTATPLEVKDNNFSGRVMANIKAREKQRLMVLTPFFMAGLASLIAFFPYGIIERFGVPSTIDPAVILPTLIPLLFLAGVVVLFTFSEEAR